MRVAKLRSKVVVVNVRVRILKGKEMGREMEESENSVSNALWM